LGECGLVEPVSWPAVAASKVHWERVLVVGIEQTLHAKDRTRGGGHLLVSMEMRFLKAKRL
jgi:hypothetical protein